MVADTADSIDERLGNNYGEYARKAADSVSGFAEKPAQQGRRRALRQCPLGGPQEPGVAIGIAAVVGFTLVRLVKAGLPRGRRRRQRRRQDQQRRHGSLSLDAPAGNQTKARSASCSGNCPTTRAPMRRRRRSSTRRSPAAAPASARNGAIALVAAALLANAALIVLLVGLALELAIHVGPALAGLIVTAVVLGIAFLLVRYGAAKLGALGGDAEEKAALAAGEKLP